MKSVLALCVGVLILAGFWYLSALEVKTNAISTESDTHYANINGDKESPLFEIDSDGNVTPATNGTTDDYYELDSNSNIMPKETPWLQDDNGDLEPIN